MSDYQKYKESHLKAQKKYDDKNREKKREYDKKRWQERKAKYQELEQLQKENKELKEVIDKLSSQIKLYGKYNGEKCTRGFSMMAADFNKLLDILKGVE